MVQVYFIFKIIYKRYSINNLIYIIYYISYYLYVIYFFIYTFLFIEIYNMTDNWVMDSLYQMFIFALNLFILIYIFISIKDFKTFFIRYLAIFITALSDIGLKYIYTDSFIDIFTKNNIEYYKSNLYLIPLSFALIQLGVEMYSFYEKNRPKYMRYKRLLEYKNSKK